MIFTDIYISNFFSITEEIHLPLDNQGLVLVIGENHDSSAADSNGAGKSSIYEGLVWCLWGKTVRGESGDSVINKTSKKDCYVYLTMRDGEQLFTIKRFRNHHQFKNGLQLWSGSTDLSEGTATLTQAKIDDLLGIDFDSFIRGPMMPQGAFKRFSQMTDSEQKVILENAIQLNLLPIALEKVKTKINEANLEQQSLTLQLENARNQWKKEKEDLEKLEQEKKNLRYQFARQKAEQLSNILWAIQEYEWAFDHWQIAVDLTPYKEALDKIIGIEQQLIKKWDADLLAVQQVEREALISQRTLHNEVQRLEVDLDRVKKLKPDTKCPACFQIITKREQGTCLIEIGSLLKLSKAKMVEAQQEYDKTTIFVRQVEEERQQSLNRAKEIKEQAETEFIQAKEKHDYNSKMTEMMDKASEVISNQSYKSKELTPLDNLIESKASSTVELSCLINKLLDSIKEKEILLDHLNFWRIGFSNAGIKSKILNSITPFMNRQADVYIRDLTDGELKIEFNTQTQLKSGQIKEQFSVEVTNKNGAKTYDGSSGGEKARADLAITLTLSDLVASRSKKSYPQRWFDEPFEAMDQAGIEAVMELLAKMVETCGTIFVITHQDSMKALFSKVVTVEKRNGATNLVA
jgi:DNA repair exonuclease SbcCD ATPase subunit